MDFYLARNSYSSEELLTMREVAELTGFSYWYIRALRSGDETTVVPFPKPTTKLGRSPLWSASVIQNWMHIRTQYKINKLQEFDG